ncbi:ATP-binding protein [Myxococcota bacterium]|nr:ATP-binding protein [Myxococcota bacterium]
MRNFDYDDQPHATRGGREPRSLGELLGCLHAARVAEGACGSEPACGGCELRRVVVASLTGAASSAAPVEVARSAHHRASLVVSTTTLDLEGRRSVVVCVEDVTERERAEQRAREAQKLESLGLLAGEIAHDFNNMLVAMSLQIGLIAERSELEGEVREGLSELRGVVARASGLTRQLLAFGRRSAVRMEMIDVGHLLRGFANMLRRVLPDSIELVVDIHEGLPPIWADYGMIEQLLMNLAINARDAMSPGGRLRIEAAPCHHDRDRDAPGPGCGPSPCLRLAISDTGCGMDEETKAHIFEPFFTTKGARDGTGLGLASARGIVKQHGGWIDVESAVGVGTTFFVHLPAYGGVHAAKKEGSVVSDGERGAREVGSIAARPRTILFAEDEVSVRSAACRVLRRAGHVVHEVSTALEALELWGRTPQIDLLVTDFTMPGELTGIDLAARLRAERPDLQVILTSGLLPPDSAAELIDRHGIRRLDKPFSPRELLAVIALCDDARSPG